MVCFFFEQNNDAQKKLIIFDNKLYIKYHLSDQKQQKNISSILDPKKPKKNVIL